MPDWKRTTKEVTFESLPPDMVAAIRQHIEPHNLGPILSDALMCVQTDSEKGKQGLFGKAETMQTAAIITPRWLVWATSGVAKTGTVVLSGQLIHLTVRDYAQTPYAKMVPDSGIEFSGLFTDTTESASAFIGLEAGPVSQRFKEVVIKAAAQAKK